MKGVSVDSQPAIVVVDDESGSRERLELTLSGRYGRDYRVLAEASASKALELLRSLRDADAAVSLIIADQWMPDETGSAFLARTREFYPTAQRLLVAAWGDFSATEPIVQASVLGEIDYFTWHPLTEADEQFHAAVTEVLARWAREHGRWGEAIKVVGERWEQNAQFLRDTLARWSLPFGFHDADSPDGRALLEHVGVSGPLPVVVLASGRALARPSPADIAAALGATTTPIDEVLDVVVLGAGPAGLAAAVYASSEGLGVLVVEPVSVGGQASSSPMLRNYLGFPGGVSGADLAGRAYQQAWTFGADFLIGRSAMGIHTQGEERIVPLDDGSMIRAQAIIIATGVSYRRMGIDSVEALVGRGVFYGSGSSEARALAGERVAVVGGANSAGAAAIHLARYAKRVTLLARRASIADTMSDYLVRELESYSNLEIRTNTEIIDARGDGRLQGLVLRNNATGSTDEIPAAAVFILIGAAPNTEWLPPEIARDERQYVLTGRDCPGAFGDARSLETTMPGVFAVGDLRYGSVKRIAAAVGEGSTAVRQVHEYREAQARQLGERPV
jgi:thioredoxin reductase (NADPH)